MWTANPGLLAHLSKDRQRVETVWNTEPQARTRCPALLQLSQSVSQVGTSNAKGFLGIF